MKTEYILLVVAPLLVAVLTSHIPPWTDEQQTINWEDQNEHMWIIAGQLPIKYSYKRLCLKPF